jgi:uncharacterized protein YndB with AHSA1/START domain
VAVNEIDIDAPPEQVFAVLADAGRYSDWVLGAVEVRGSDAEWPSAGSALHHSTGIGPLTLKDDTRVLEAEPPTRLVLLASTEPLGAMRVTLELEERTAGTTHVVMTEEPASGLLDRLENPLTHWLVGGRNIVSLHKLKGIAEKS